MGDSTEICSLHLVFERFNVQFIADQLLHHLCENELCDCSLSVDRPTVR